MGALLSKCRKKDDTTKTEEDNKDDQTELGSPSEVNNEEDAEDGGVSNAAVSLDDVTWGDEADASASPDGTTDAKSPSEAHDEKAEEAGISDGDVKFEVGSARQETNGSPTKPPGYSGLGEQDSQLPRYSMWGGRTSYWEKVDVGEQIDLMGKNGQDNDWYSVVDNFATNDQPAIDPHTQRKGWRTVRLFISSTFKDMHSEREHLVTLVLPVLRQWCEARKLRLIECDLRWGIPKDADTKETLLTCLSEIDRCRSENEQAYFLSMLSERYGFVMPPEEVPSDIKARYKWLPGMSITSLEIMAGAYWDRNPNALFMMRKKDFLPNVDKEIKAAYAETDDELNNSLSVLKDKLKKRFPGRVHEYGCKVEGREGNRMHIADLEEFGKTVMEHFKACIDKQYPEVAGMRELTDMEIRHAEQEDFMLQRSEVLLGRDDEIQKIDDYINKDSSTDVLALIGYPGAGKSALMAYAAKHHIDNASLKVYFHFVGVSPDSTSVFSVLSRLYRECMPAEQQASMPLDEDEMARFVPTMLNEALKLARREGKDKLVVFIDALNQLDDKGNAHKLGWLPRVLPEGVRVVVSTLEGTCLDSLLNHAKPPQEVPVNPLSVEIRQEIAHDLLIPFNKRLDPEQMQILVKKSDSGRPLYLSMACEELRVYGEFRKLTDKIRFMPDDLGGLVGMVIQRVVESFGGDIVRAALCYIECANFGLEEDELLRLLAVDPVIPDPRDGIDANDFKEKLPMATWGFIYVGLRPFLRPSGSTGNGRVDFYHRIISKVVRRTFLEDKETKDLYHKRLIAFFSGSRDIARKAEELPYHYIATKNMEGLRRLLLTRPMFEDLYNGYKVALMHYWQVAGGYHLAAELYTKNLKDIISFEHQGGSEPGEVLWCQVARFLVDIGEYDAAEAMLGELITTLTAKYGAEAIQLAEPLHVSVLLLTYKALKFVYGSHPGYRECCNKGSRLSPLTAKVNREKYGRSVEFGKVLLACGYFDHDLQDECKAIFEEHNNNEGLAVVYFMMGERNQYNRDISVPIQLFEKSLALCKVYYGYYHLLTARCVQLFGQLYWNRYTQNHDTGLLAACLPHYQMELDILQEILGQHHPTTVRSREDVIIILQTMGRDKDAHKYLADQPVEAREGIA